MIDFWTVALVVARVTVLLLAIATTAISCRAYRRTRARYLRDATVGFSVMTVGVFVEGVLYQFTRIGLTQVHVIESIAIGLGFVILLRSFLR